MLVILVGIVIKVRALQPEKAPSPKQRTLSGIVMEVNAKQLENAFFSILITLLGITT